MRYGLNLYIQCRCYVLKPALSFDPALVRFAVDKGPLGYVFLRVHRLPSVIVIPSFHRIHLHLHTSVIRRTSGRSLKTNQGSFRGHAVVETLRYNPEVRRFDSRWGHWDFLLTWSFRPHYVRGVDSTYNRNEYQEYLLGGNGDRCLGLTTLRPSSDECREKLGALISWNPQVFYRIAI